MKKLFYQHVNWLAFSTQAQEISKNAIGLRLGDSGGFELKSLIKSFGK
jgi:hypothetical protein